MLELVRPIRAGIFFKTAGPGGARGVMPRGHR